MSQTRLQSAIESAANVAIGYAVAVASQLAIFPLFGILFIAMAVKQAKFQKHNATAKDRHSIVDVVDSTEEGDPFAKFDRAEAERKAAEASVAADAFCTRCGAPLQAEDNFCPKCGNPVK